MTERLLIRLPDIGDVRDVVVAEVLIEPGSTLGRETPILVVETDKASLEVPATVAGVVDEISVKVGDRISQGSVIAALRAPDEGHGSARRDSDIGERAVEASAGGSTADLTCGLVVIGGGPGGYSAAFRAADLGLDVVLVERHARLGGVCLNVGCIPSKALLHLTATIDDARAASRHGITFAPPRIDLGAIRAWTEDVVANLTNGLAAMARARKVRVVRGSARFAGHDSLRVESPQGADPTTQIRFETCIVAAGSRPVRPAFLPDDPRVIDSTGALALPSLPGRMLVIGGGIVGLEMATVYASLGAEVDVVEIGDRLMPGADRDLVAIWSATNRDRLGRVMVETRAASVTERPDGLWVVFEGADATPEPARYDLVLAAAGRVANGDRLAAEAAGLTVARDGTLAVDRGMRTSNPRILAIGDAAGAPMLAHKAVHEGHVAAEVAAGLPSVFDATVIPSVAYTRPEIAWVGLTEARAEADGVPVTVSRFPWAASGRAHASDAAQGLTKLLFDATTGRIVGGGIVGAHAGELIAEIALAIEMGADATDLGRTVHPHPTLSETIGLAAEIEDGTCTDVPPRRTGSANTKSPGAPAGVRSVLPHSSPR